MHIEYILKQFYGATHIPACAYSSAKGDLLVKEGFSKIDPWEEDPLLLHKIMSNDSSGSDLYIHTEFDAIRTILLYLSSGEIIALGPVCLYNSPDFLSKKYALQHRLPKEFSLPVSDWFSFNSAISLLYYALTGEELNEQASLFPDFDTATFSTEENIDFENYRLNISDKERKRYSYVDEQEKMRAITEGDVKSIQDELTPDEMIKSQELIGEMSELPKKQWEYSVVTSIALSSRAAIAGGLPLEYAYSLSDTLLQQVAHCQNLQQMMSFAFEVRITFATAVKEYHLQDSNKSCVEKAKNYMKDHLNKTITLEDLEQACNVTKYHLCHEFKKATGQTTKEYLQEQRIKVSKDMLKHTTHSISYIANYLCFNSQSYFAKVFKEKTGQTPMQYRNSNYTREKRNAT